MTTIRASCPTCGDVTLTSEQMRLVVCSHPAWSSYVFSCPSCAEQVRRHADTEVVNLLISGGVQVDGWHVPEEVFEERPGPPLTYDDLLDFALALRGTDELTPGLRQQA